MDITQRLIRRFPWLAAHWLTYAFFLPVAVMLGLHKTLHLSAALMVATLPGEREAHAYNLIMVSAYFLGLAGFLAHTGILGYRGLKWVWIKLGSLIALWVALAIVLR